MCWCDVLTCLMCLRVLHFLMFVCDIPQVLAAGIETFNGNELTVFDIDSESDSFSINCHQNIVWDIAWSYCKYDD